jgi:predicted nucleic acid-binding protein
MSDRTFVDTNVLVYADDFANPAKRDHAQELIRRLIHERSGVVSLQVLQEYFAAVTRKLRMDSGDARERVEVYSRFNVVKLEPEDVLHAIDLHRAHRISIWDSLIVRAASVAGCRTLYTEDLQNGFRIENLEVVNPFMA